MIVPAAPAGWAPAGAIDNASALRAKWSELEIEVRMRWSRLTLDDVEGVRGDADQLSALLQRRYGYDRQQAEQELSAWLRASR